MLKQLKQFKKSLDFFYEDIREIPSNLTTKISKIIFLDVENDDFWGIIKENWSNIDNNSLNFSQLYKEYKNKKRIRNQAQIDSEKLSDSELILKYNTEESWLLDAIDNKRLSDKDIKFYKQRILEMPELFDKREIVNYQEYSILSFKVFDDFPLSINIHLMLTKGISYNFFVFFTIRICYPEYLNKFYMKFIDNYYNKSIIFYDLIQTLNKLNFLELDPYYAHREQYFKEFITQKDQYSTRNKSGYINPFFTESPKTYLNFPPIEFKCFVVNMLNNSGISSILCL